MALADDAAPFKMQRFPQFVARLAKLAAAHAPHVEPNTVPGVEQFVVATLTRASTQHVELEHDFEASPPTVTISLPGRRAQIGVVLDMFATAFAVPSADELGAMLAAASVALRIERGSKRLKVRFMSDGVW